MREIRLMLATMLMTAAVILSVEDAFLRHLRDAAKMKAIPKPENRNELLVRRRQETEVCPPTNPLS